MVRSTDTYSDICNKIYYEKQYINFITFSRKKITLPNMFSINNILLLRNSIQRALSAIICNINIMNLLLYKIIF